MVCSYCNSKTKVVNSRAQKRNNQVWRRRRCLSCGSVFTTHEGAELSSLIVVEGLSKPKPFLTDKLFTEILLAMQDHKSCYVAAREVTNTIIAKLLKMPGKPVYDTHQISKAATEVLKRFDRRVWLRYMAEHPSVAQKRL
jgi:transcriptional repressor NrdR